MGVLAYFVKTLEPLVAEYQKIDLACLSAVKTLCEYSLCQNMRKKILRGMHLEPSRQWWLITQEVQLSPGLQGQKQNQNSGLDLKSFSL